MKCPLCYQDNLPRDDDPRFCLVKDKDEWLLKEQHQYFYQVQLQMYVCDVPFCDFVVRTKGDFACTRVKRNVTFTEEKLDDAKQFFIYGILPEIVGKWYSRKPVANADGVVPLPEAETRPGDNNENGNDDGDPTKLWATVTSLLLVK